jgi:predicted kinase
MVGLPGAGKTARAKELAAGHRALRLSPDAWMIPLFGESEAGGKRDVLEGRLIWLALQALRLGTSVVLDFGLWARDERSALRWLARSAGASCQVVYLPVDRATQLARIRHRLAVAPQQTFVITEAELDSWRAQFQVRPRARYRPGWQLRHGLSVACDRLQAGRIGQIAEARLEAALRSVTVTVKKNAHRPIWSAVPVRRVTVLTAPNCRSARRAEVVLDEAILVAVTSATPTRPRSLPAKPLWPRRTARSAIPRSCAPSSRRCGWLATIRRRPLSRRSRPSSPAPSRQAIPSGWWKDAATGRSPASGPSRPRTASVRVSSILAKPGVSTRAEAAATVHRMHILDGQ